jgi:hypothetical protein
MGYTFLRRRIKFIAYILLFNIVFNLLQPLSAYALTSGPAQPEAQSFQPAGVSDMVDLFSGDFKYNIPLMDVDGYPLNLNYQSGVGMDDEASWVGLGWNLNVGSISRQLRGVPDDFMGDTLVTTHSVKEKVTVGGRLTAKVELKGKAKLGGSFSFGVFSDNYTGIGAEIGVNAGMSFSLVNSGILTSSMGLGVLSNTSSGVDITPNISMSIGKHVEEKAMNYSGLSSSLGYNSRSGLKSLTLGTSFGSTSYFSSPNISYNTEPVSPKIQIPYSSTYSSFSFDVGGVAFAVFGGGGGTGYMNKRQVAGSVFKNPEYGFLYADLGKNVKKAVQDFIREKENPIINELPNLALPVHTPDIFTYNSQAGSGQFRLYRGGTGVFADNEVTDISEVSTAGFDIGLGLYAHGGFTKFDQTTTNVTRKWTGDNQYLAKGDFQAASKDSLKWEHVFFRKVGEQNIENSPLNDALFNGNNPISVNINQASANSMFNTNASFATSNIPTPIINKQQQRKGTVISYLTAREAIAGGLEKGINTYNFIDSATFNINALVNAAPTVLPRIDKLLGKAAHHISEISVTDQSGGRTVYGVPVYNKKQEEYSFAIGGNNTKNHDYTVIAGNVAILTAGSTEPIHNKGIDEYYHKETQPGYASSYLLTAVLSPDYVDKEGNGISKDDLGTGIKFNYSRIADFRWRTPYAMKSSGSLTRTTAVNKGLLADPDDDKGSIIYGEKELYYVHSIESKTQVAYFITEDRLDGLGVVDWKGDINPTVKQKRLKEIRLYSKFDRSKPIKTVKFDYTYELCPNTPNSTSTIFGTGKLTLKRVWFEYGNSKKGKQHQYVFTYGKNDVHYTTMATDRWGSYKSAPNPGSLTNEEFPYSVQNKASADTDAALYHLSKIELPTGGIIDITYEADDYAYVQNKRAAVMTSIDEMQGGGGTSVLEGSSGVKIKLGAAPPNTFTPAQKLDWFKNNYLNGSNYLYTKLYVEITKDDKLSYGLRNDFISTYCRVTGVNVDSSRVATIDFEKVNEAGLSNQSPISFSAWQKIKNEYPRYAYPGFMNRIKANSVGSSAEAAISAIISAAGNLTELKENFYKKAERKDFAKFVIPSKSFVRITKDTGYKIGGGSRVKKILINDNWKDFTGDNTANTGKYGQSYEYTIDEGGKKISSGVASYEPPVGNDENPLKQPVSYTQKIKGAISNFFELEAPFGESFFPAAAVGYSKVTVRDLNANGEEDPNPQTGAVISEFYTAREFPVRVSVLPIQKYNPKKEQTYSLVKTNSYEEMTLSQGYCIELNDMHGKPRANRVLNKAGAEISSTVYHYSVENEKAEVLKLNNRVDVINSNGTVSEDVYMSRDIELFTDFREQESKNSGQAINIGLDLIPALFGFPWPLPHWPINGNNEYKRFRSACAVKVIQNYGIVKKVVKTENGSSIATENIAYDGVTGAALVTRTENEFNKSFYSVNMPAYWAYKGMGPAYQNLGTLLENVVTNSTGAFANSTFSNFVAPGDELVDISAGKRYWVIETAGAKRLIDSVGNVKQTNISIAKITRSGYRNILQPATSMLVCQENPIQGNVFKLAAGGDLSSLNVISASTSLFDQKWAVEAVSAKQQANSNMYYKEDTTRSYMFCASPNLPQLTRWLVDTIGESGSEPEHKTMTSPYFIGGEGYGPYFRSGIQLCVDEDPINSRLERAGFDVCITVDETKDYFVVFASPDGAYIYSGGFHQLRGSVIVVKRKFYAGKNTISFNYVTNEPGDSRPRSQYNYGFFEIYENSFSEICNADINGTGLKRIFSSGSVRNQHGLYNYKLFNAIDYYNHYNSQNYSFGLNGSPPSPCEGNPNLKYLVINPYTSGYYGNWRPYQTNVYQESRKYGEVFTAGSRGTKVENAGYFTTFKSWWGFQSNQWVGASTSKWVTANTVTLYDKFGQELENKDALNRYSAANFDFNGELPSSVASNAMNREIYANSFEDTKFRLKYHVDTARTKFTLTNGSGISPIIDSIDAHSGRYDLKLDESGIVLKTKINSQQQKPFDYLSGSVDGYHFDHLFGLYPNGFEPSPSKKYIINTWVKDGQASNRNVNIKAEAKISGSTVPISLTCKAVVEGWKLLEGRITTSNVIGLDFELTLKSKSGTVLIDDIRIHPFDAHMKTYVYNSKDFKLMAELDENAFATFYEYDEEGSLVRVKKETERGILTIKESRSSYRKRVN